MSGEIRVVPCGRTDGQTYRERERDKQTGITDLIFPFSNFRTHIMSTTARKHSFTLPRLALAIFYHEVALSTHITELCHCFMGRFCFHLQGKTPRALFPPPNSGNCVNNTNCTKCLKTADCTTNIHHH